MTLGVVRSIRHVFLVDEEYRRPRVLIPSIAMLASLFHCLTVTENGSGALRSLARVGDRDDGRATVLIDDERTIAPRTCFGRDGRFWWHPLPWVVSVLRCSVVYY